ncbi:MULTISPECIES: plasmid replication protein RepC [unclassified Ensifer]|uniref:plasmid replication protein RepC n=1 Tax=unclassified Ensifer TaxID=2633371 RepID=UPI0008130842|nr:MULTISPECIES: plasmid replication protein RepC [unclassified Ensifer]OCP15972.1 replication initiation protein RepC [Ensifer sp. LC384]OCP20041.1 replication initiation protein RepC [Ensifer sp. LC54]OCP35471.1 replication initiation protein RepC [Ensifer sp. LC163]
MERGNVTTPFGRRAMTLGMFASQVTASEIDSHQQIDKWKLFRTVCEAKAVVGVSDRALAVLNALLSFYPKVELTSGKGLVVFPSNNQLALRTHGMAGTTLRRHLAALVDAGLILRKDSPNGKRYARRDSKGSIGDAFGFDLSPLLARAHELQTAAAAVALARQEAQLARERLSLCRRDLTKLIDVLRETDGTSDWSDFQSRYLLAVDILPRKPGLAEIEPVLKQLDALRVEVLNQLEKQLNLSKTATNDSQNGCHIQSSHPDSSTESEPGFGSEAVASLSTSRSSSVPVVQPNHREAITTDAASRAEMPKLMPGEMRQSTQAFPLSTVLKACPDIVDYGPGGKVQSWRDLMLAAVVVRSMLNVSQGAHDEACRVLGPEVAAAVLACILQRSPYITSAGGYLRDLTRRSLRQEFAVGPMIMALLRANTGDLALAS